MSSGFPDDPPLVQDRPRAFVAVRHDGRTWVVDLHPGLAVTLGSSPTAVLHVPAPDVAASHLLLEWDGTALTLRDESGAFGTHVNGKRIQGAVELRPGDEVSAGSARLVVGIAVPTRTGARRTLTHQEFRERLAEELARAARGGRHTVLAMLHARAGDGARLAQASLQSFRAGDVIGAYAHDELELLLPDTVRELGRSVCERIVAASGLSGVAVGIAVAPSEGDSPDRLIRAARASLARARGDAAPVWRDRSENPVPTFHDPVSQRLLRELEDAAQADAPILFTGELSAGKSVFARRVHAQSARASGPFVVFHCGTLGESGGERVFGATASSGTGSVAMDARGGTLFLDEVGELGPRAQLALRAFLEREGAFVRLVTSSFRDLDALVERDAFDAELLAKIAGIVVHVPALRDRPEDILPLAEHYAAEFGAKPPVQFTPGAIARLRSYPWPGNVLELRNAIERAVALSQGGELLAEFLPGDVMSAVSGEGRLREHVDSVERDAIVKALAENNHNQTHAAKRLGISRRALIYKMEKYGLKSPPGQARRG